MDWIELGRNIQPWATIGALTVAGCSLFIAAKSLRLTSKTNKAKFVFDLTESFLKEPSLKAFWYRIDYDKQPDAWHFVLSTFRYSEEERLIDTILYKFNIIGHMIRNKAVTENDIIGLYTICRQFFHNNEIREYLRFVQLDFYCSDGFTHLHFEDGLYCYRLMTTAAVRRRFVQKNELTECARFIRELKSIPRNEQLRRTIADRIGYTLTDPPLSRRSLWALITAWRTRAVEG